MGPVLQEGHSVSAPGAHRWAPAASQAGEAQGGVRRWGSFLLDSSEGTLCAMLVYVLHGHAALKTKQKRLLSLWSCPPGRTVISIPQAREGPVGVSWSMEDAGQVQRPWVCREEGKVNSTRAARGLEGPQQGLWREHTGARLAQGSSQPPSPQVGTEAALAHRQTSAWRRQACWGRPSTGGSGQGGRGPCAVCARHSASTAGP